VAAVNMTSALDRNTFELQRLGTTLLDEGIFGRDSKVGNMLDEFVMGDPTKYTEKFVDSVIGLIKGDGKKRATAKDLDDMLMIDGKVPGLDEFRTGTNGFRNFGAGTPVVLHGTEAVVPKNDIGQLAGLLSEVGATTATPTGDTITNNTNVDMTALTISTRELVDLNKKVAQHLNTLVTIGAMTEKNTKNFNNRLANMGGSLV
jgi:hypothetical protein